MCKSEWKRAPSTRGVTCEGLGTWESCSPLWPRPRMAHTWKHHPDNRMLLNILVLSLLSRAPSQEWCQLNADANRTGPKQLWHIQSTVSCSFCPPIHSSIPKVAQLIKMPGITTKHIYQMILVRINTNPRGETQTRMRFERQKKVHSQTSTVTSQLSQIGGWWWLLCSGFCMDIGGRYLFLPVLSNWFLQRASSTTNPLSSLLKTFFCLLGKWTL